MPVYAPSSGYRYLTKDIIFDGTAGAGAVGQVTVATVTGIVFIRKIVLFGIEDLVSAGGGTVSLGHAGAVTALIGATTGTAIQEDDYWVSTTPGSTILALPAALQTFMVGTNITANVATADITGGTIRVSIEYDPMDGTIT